MTVRLRMGDFAAIQGVLGAAAVELVIRELYHQVAAEAFKMVGLVAVWILVSVVAVIGVRPIVRRSALLIAFGASSWVLLGESMVTVVQGRPVSVYVVVAGALGALASVVWITRLQEARWATLRRAIVVGCILFVAIQPVLVAFRAPTLSWPPSGEPVAALPAGGRSTTVFLLLDELNATSAAPFVALLERQGLRVKTKSLLPVGDGTAKVIPALFTGLRFDEPKPCSPTAVCSGPNVLDFARISVSRSDVDVVGFFQPYCSMPGLRYCVRGTAASPAFDWLRWQCAAWRRTGFPRTVSSADCEQAYNGAWAKMVEGVVMALGRAPIWEQGGFLFAHLPLPHPPGLTLGASLQAHYEQNLGRALDVLGEIVARSRTAPGDQLRIVIFSDHPLRQDLWCKTYFPYASNHCAAVDALKDTKVPLIVAANVELPTIDNITTNDQVFTLVSAWR